MSEKTDVCVCVYVCVCVCVCAKTPTWQYFILKKVVWKNNCSKAQRKKKKRKRQSLLFPWSVFCYFAALVKARSSIGADRDSGATRPMLSPHGCHPLLAINQVDLRTKVKPPMKSATPHDAPPPPSGVWRCLVAAKYIGLWGQISSFGFVAQEVRAKVRKLTSSTACEDIDR